MDTATLATITAFEVVLFSEYYKTFFRKVIIARFELVSDGHFS
jgi:hypothetical protein